MAGEIEVGRAAVRIFADDSQYWRKIREISATRVKDIKITADADTATARANVEALKKSTASADDEIDISVNRRGIASLGAARAGLTSLGNARSGIDALGERIRNLGEILKLVKIPALIGAIGGIPAVATAAAVQIGQLALGIGQGLAGAAIVGGTAIAGFAAGLKAYVSIVGAVISNSREAYLEITKETQAQLEHQRQLILNTRASYDFNIALDKMITEFTRLQAQIGRRVFPTFESWINLLRSRLPAIRPILFRLVDGVTRVADSFVKAAASGQRFQNVRRILGFVASSGIRAAQAIKNLGLGLIAAIQPVLRPAANLQKTIVDLTRSFRRWAESARGQNQITRFIQTAWQRAKQLWAIVRNLTTGFSRLFSILRPGTGNLMRSLVRITGQFARLGKEGTASRRAIEAFVKNAQPIMRAFWRLVKEAARQFFLLAGNVAKAGKSGKQLNPVVRILNSIRRALPQIRKLLQNTFNNLAPVISKLIPQLARFFRQFAGSTGVLQHTLRLMTRMLRLFNNLPDPVKNLVAELIAFRIVARLLGFSILGKLIASLASMALNMGKARRQSGPLAKNTRELGKAGRGASGGMLLLGKRIALIAWPVALAAAFGDKLFRGGRAAHAFTRQLHEAVPAIKQFNERLQQSNDGDHLAGIVNTLGSLSTGKYWSPFIRKMGLAGDSFMDNARKSAESTKHMRSNWDQTERHLTGRSVIPDMVNAMKKHLGPEMKKGTDAGASNARSMKDQVAARMREMNNNARSNMQAFVQIIKSVNLTSVGQGLIEGLLNGMKSAWSGAQDWLQSIAESIPDAVKKVLDQSSPSKVMYQVGSDAILGLINALRDSLTSVREAAGGVASAAIPDMRGGRSSRQLARIAARHPYVDYGTVSERRWERLMSMGYTGRAGDSRERIYAPNITISQSRDDDERTVREVRRYLRQLRRQRESRSSIYGGA